MCLLMCLNHMFAHGKNQASAANIMATGWDGAVKEYQVSQLNIKVCS